MSGMKVSQAVKAARGHWARILPALGVNILKNCHQPCPVCAGRKIVFASTIWKVVEHGSATSAGAGTV